MTGLTKKHFKKFAAAIKDLPPEYSRQTRVSMACLISRVCAEDNYLFDMNKFYEACGLNDDTHKEAQQKAEAWLERAQEAWGRDE